MAVELVVEGCSALGGGVVVEDGVVVVVVIGADVVVVVVVGGVGVVVLSATVVVVGTVVVAGVVVLEVASIDPVATVVVVAVSVRGVVFAPAAATPTAEPELAAIAKPAVRARTCRRIQPPLKTLRDAGFEDAVIVSRRGKGAGSASALRLFATSVNSASGYSTTSSGKANDARHSSSLVGAGDRSLAGPAAQSVLQRHLPVLADDRYPMVPSPVCTTSLAPTGAAS